MGAGAPDPVAAASIISPRPNSGLQCSANRPAPRGGALRSVTTQQSCGRISTRRAHGWQRGADAQGLGRSRGGLSTKIHAATDALGNPVRLLFGSGQRNNITQAHDLIEGFEAQAIIAYKGYDADHLREAVRASDAEPVIPPKSNRRTPLTYDKTLYKERNIVERFFNKLKQFRGGRCQIRQAPRKLQGIRHSRRYCYPAQVNRHHGLVCGNRAVLFQDRIRVRGDLRHSHFIAP